MLFAVKLARSLCVTSTGIGMESKSWAEKYYSLVKWQDLCSRDMHFCQEVIHAVLITTEKILGNPNVAQVYVWHDQASSLPSPPSEFVELSAEAKANEIKEIAIVLANKPPSIVMLDGCDSYAKIRVEEDGNWVLFFNFLICAASKLPMSAGGKQAIVAALVASLLHEISKLLPRHASSEGGGVAPMQSREGSTYKGVESLLFKGCPLVLSSGKGPSISINKNESSFKELSSL